MPLPKKVREMVDQKVQAFLEARQPESMKHLIRLGYRVRGNYVSLYQFHYLIANPPNWARFQLAQLRHDPRKRTWTLWRPGPRGRWRPYPWLEPTRNFDALLEEICWDRHCCFWA